MRLAKIGERWHLLEHGCAVVHSQLSTATEVKESADVDWNDRCKNCDERFRHKGRYGARAKAPAAEDLTVYKPRFRFKDHR